MKLLTKDSNAKIKKTNKLLKKENIEFYNLTLTSKIITKKEIQRDSQLVHRWIYEGKILIRNQDQESVS